MSGGLLYHSFYVKTIGKIPEFKGHSTMSISGIAAVLGVSKSFLYTLVKEHKSEVPKSREDMELWSAFVNRWRIEPTGNDRIRLSPRERS